MVGCYGRYVTGVCIYRMGWELLLLCFSAATVYGVQEGGLMGPAGQGPLHRKCAFMIVSVNALLGSLA